jgi:hypothetical protein
MSIKNVFSQDMDSLVREEKVVQCRTRDFLSVFANFGDEFVGESQKACHLDKLILFQVISLALVRFWTMSLIAIGNKNNVISR